MIRYQIIYYSIKCNKRLDNDMDTCRVRGVQEKNRTVRYSNFRVLPAIKFLVCMRLIACHIPTNMRTLIQYSLMLARHLRRWPNITESMSCIWCVLRGYDYHIYGVVSYHSSSLVIIYSASTRRWPHSGSMLTNRPRRWPNIKPA